MERTLGENETREQPRQRQLRSAKIVYGNGNCVFDCALKDLSESGARIDLGIVLPLPSTFWVHFSDGTKKREAEVVWHKGTMLGVRFLDATGSGANTPAGTNAKFAILDRITQLEKQLAEIRRDLMILLSK